jgi:hypothetical protein
MASGVMIYGGFVYLPKTVMNAAYMCSSTYIWVDSGDFKDCLYMPYSDRSTITIPPMRSSMTTANDYKLINTNVLDMCGILIFPNGDIAHLVFSKKNNKVMRIVASTTITTEHIINNGYFARYSSNGISADAVTHLMANNESEETIFKYLSIANITREDFYVFNIRRWSDIYTEYRKSLIHFHLTDTKYSS